MQVNLERGKAALGARSAGRFVAILAGVPLAGILALSVPDQALAACGASAPAGAHPATSSGGSVHTATSIPPASGGGSGGGGGTLGCANGSSASALRGLPMATSGRVMEGGAHATHIATHARTAATRTAGAGAHLRGARPPRHP